MRMPVSAGLRRLLAVGLSAMLLLTVVGVAPVAASDQGCSPGYWKNHDWPAAALDPDDTVGALLGAVPAGASWVTPLYGNTLLQALGYPGGPGQLGAARILLRAAVASYLNSVALGNSAHPWDAIGPQIPAAFVYGSRTWMLELASELDMWNNQYCPLN